MHNFSFIDLNIQQSFISLLILIEKGLIGLSYCTATNSFFQGDQTCGEPGGSLAGVNNVIDQPLKVTIHN